MNVQACVERISVEKGEIDALALRWSALPAEQIVAAAAARFREGLTFATGFGREGCVLIDMFARRGLAVDVFTLDTGLFFPQTLDLWARLEDRYGLRIRAVKGPPLQEQAAQYGPDLWARDPHRCCTLRKVIPLKAELARFEAWMSAIRRDQTPDRAAARVVEWDGKFGLVKINPLLAWSESDLDAYIRRNDVPVNPLHEQGYPSIGCFPCTTPVKPGEEARAGRWRGHAKTECGLHARGGERG